MLPQGTALLTADIGNEDSGLGEDIMLSDTQAIDPSPSPNDTEVLKLKAHVRGLPPLPASIHQLATETLIKILRHAIGIELEDVPQEGDYRQLHLLAQVCKAWADIARSPGLWTAISSNDPHWKTVLARSRSHPLTISMRGTIDVDPTFLTAMVDNLNRWQAADLLYNADLSALEKSSAPLLETFSITRPQSLPDDTLSHRVVDLFQGNSPRLRSLKLDRVQLSSWDSKIMTGLRTLHLRRLGGDVPLSVDQVLQLLRDCPDMEDFEIQRTPIHHEFGKTARRQVVKLPRLQSLSLDIIPIKAVGIILTAIQCRSAKHLNFQVLYASAEIAHSLTKAVMLFAMPSLAAAVRTGSRVILAIHWPWEINVKSKVTLEPDFRLVLPIGVREISWLPTFLGQASGGLPISISYSNSYPALPPPSFDTLWSTPFVDTIDFGRESKIGQAPEGFDAVLQELSQATSSPHDAHTWRFPALTRVHLRDSRVKYDPQLLLEMVRARAGAAACADVGGEATQGHPMPLERLEIPGLDESMDVETWGEIKMILGEGAVWNRRPVDLETR
ncbi:hypothetical protein FRB94_001388 [Tulasnella sp. JGI-2019a]|nr:hypothetical protein FRB94_001388 [Tulasnella sp. JGI-2019a]